MLALDTVWQTWRGNAAPAAGARVAVGAAVLAATLAAAAALERLAGRLPFRPGLALVGLALALCGLALHLWARRALGRLWTPAVAVRGPRVLVQHGPYAYVRHPLYAGAFLLAAGTLLAHPSPAIACLVTGLAAGLVLKMRAEERALRAALGEEFARYAARVPAVVPRLRLSGRPR